MTRFYIEKNSAEIGNYLSFVDADRVYQREKGRLDPGGILRLFEGDRVLRIFEKSARKD